MHHVALQQSQRLFREGLSQLLSAEDDIDVVATATSAEELVTACGATRPTVVLVEADAPDWDAQRVATALRRCVPRSHKLRVVGMTTAEASSAQAAGARRGGVSALVCRAGGIADILHAVRNEVRPLQSVRLAGAALSRPDQAQPVKAVLTVREVTVLSLVGAGLTSREISGRLDISHKTVENHKQRIFGKLNVQSQAHAVSVAMRAGLIRPDRVIDLAVSD